MGNPGQTRLSGPLREKEDDQVEKFGRFFCFGLTLSDMAPLLAVKNLSCVWPEGDPMFENVNFSVNEGDIIVLQARSGSGCVVSIPVSLTSTIHRHHHHASSLSCSKTTLLKCIAHLYLYHGTVEFRGK